MSVRTPSYGHALMHDSHPMHSSLSTVTMPVSSSLAVAPVGHTSKHAGFSQCWHWKGRNRSVGSSYVPPAQSLETAPFATAKPSVLKSLSAFVYTTL